MTSPETSRRIWTMTIRRFAEVAWSHHGPLRYVSVTLTPILVALLVPGYWWALCSLGAVIGVIIDIRTQAAFARLSKDLDHIDEAALRNALGKYIAALATVTAAYVLPYAALAFAPQPAPVIGLLFGAGGALICATLHVMTRTMIFYTIPSIVLAMVLNAVALSEGGALFAVMPASL